MQVFAHGDLRLYLLALLAGGPKHGYEIITALRSRFGGTYSPSAGTVYPRLARLEVEGLVTTARQGRRTQYLLTDSGAAELAARQHQIEGIEAGISDSVRRLADETRRDVQAYARSLRAEIAAAADAAGHPRSAGPGLARERSQGHWRVSELEFLLTDFRDDLRVELRRASASAGVRDVTVETVRTVLEQAKASIRATLPP